MSRLLQSYCEEVTAGIDQATADANALLPITAQLISSCTSNDTLAAVVAEGIGAGHPVPELLQQLQVQRRQRQRQELLQQQREVLSVE